MFYPSIPSSAAKVAGYMEAGFKPMKDRTQPWARMVEPGS